MRVLLSWLKDFIPLELSADKIAETLDDLGLVVESICRTGEEFQGVVVAKVLDIQPILGAKNIQKVLVDAGDGAKQVEVVCGAHNFAEGDIVPLAKPGAKLPGGIEIQARKVMGVLSNGMLCSAKELALADDASGIMILGEAGGVSQTAATGLEPGSDLSLALGIQKDVVFDISVEANRPDAMSIVGVARDLAARLKLPFTPLEPTWDSLGFGDVSTADLASVTVEDEQYCQRFCALVIQGLTVSTSPDWLRNRLLSAGMRPINSCVDVSNYVMLELGQPNHPYDLDRLGGAGLIVRRSIPGDSLVTLDGQRRTFGGDARGDAGQDCLICNANNEPVGIGGIMGGADTEITSSTKQVLLEAAYFLPAAIAGTSRRLGLRTEASVRFERGCDPWGIDTAMWRFCSLLTDINGAGKTVISKDLIDIKDKLLPKPVKLSVKVDKINSLLGTALESKDIGELLKPMGFFLKTVESRGDEDASHIEAGAESGNVLEVSVPSFRPDVSIQADVAEEIARQFGYSNIPRTRPARPLIGRLTPYQRDRRKLKEVLVGLGITEAWTTTFLAPGDHEKIGLREKAVEVANPLIKEESFLRKSLLPGLLKALLYNVSRQQGDVRLFEIGHVFDLPDNGAVRDVPFPLPVERESLGVLLAWPDDGADTAVRIWRTIQEAFHIEGVVLKNGQVPTLHPSRGATLMTHAEEELGVVGEIDSTILKSFGLVDSSRKVGWLTLDVEMLLGSLRQTNFVSRSISRFPSHDIDLAFVVPDEVPASAVKSTLVEAAGELLESIDLFDVYKREDNIDSGSRSSKPEYFFDNYSGVQPTGNPKDNIDSGSRSLAWHLRFRAIDRTLTDEDIEGLIKGCIEKVFKSHSARLRG